MAQIHKLMYKTELNCSAYKFYGAYKNATQMPKILPQLYKSVEFTEGDGTSLGSARKWTYAIERITTLDEENMIISVTVIEGELLNQYDNLVGKLSVTPKGDQGCMVEWTIEYEEEKTPTMNNHIKFLKMVSTNLGDYLAKE